MSWVWLHTCGFPVKKLNCVKLFLFFLLFRQTIGAGGDYTRVKRRLHFPSLSLSFKSWIWWKNCREFHSLLFRVCDSCRFWGVKISRRSLKDPSPTIFLTICKTTFHRLQGSPWRGWLHWFIIPSEQQAFTVPSLRATRDALSLMKLLQKSMRLQSW